MSIDDFQGRKLRYNDTLTYRSSQPAAQNPLAPTQLAEQGPYTSKLVEFTDTMIGVRADGFYGQAFLYYVFPDDILSVEPYVAPRSAGITYLHVPVPATLEQIIGYEGNARFVAFYWGAGDETEWADGRSSATGNWDGYLAYVDHMAVAPALTGYDFGSSEAMARHWLILDREQRMLYAASVREAKRFLQQQWPLEPPIEGISQEEALRELMESLNARNWQEAHAIIDRAEIMRRMQEHQEMISEMQAFLDKSLPSHQHSSHNNGHEGGNGVVL